MPRILLIENDPGFAGDLARVLSATGYETQVVGDGREGLARVAAWRPDGIVLSVELPDMSGYLVCQRLRKDEALRTIPLVLTSADATEKSFADHQKLKVRADAYLLKPYPPQTLLESLARLVPPPQGGGTDEEELVRLEDGGDGLPPLDLADEVPRGRLDDDVAAPAPTVDEFESLAGLGDEGPPPAGGSDETDGASLAGSGLELDLDAELERDAQDLGRDLGDTLERPMTADDLDAASASLPDHSRDPLEALGDLGDEVPRAAHGGDDEKTPSEPLRPVSGSPAPKVKPASADLLRAAGIKLLGDEDEPDRDGGLPSTRAPTSSTTTTRVMRAVTSHRSPAPDLPEIPELGDLGEPETPATTGSIAERLERELNEVRQKLSDTRSEILSRDSEIRALKDKVSALTRRAEQAEAQVREARNEAGEASELRERLSAAERRAEEAAGRRAEAERRAAEAERRASEAASRADGAEAAARARAEEDAEAGGKVEALRTELEAARADAEAVKAELARAKAQAPATGPVSAALEKRIAELEAANAKNEERVLKAYQKIRGDEKVRDKVRKALSIASQLLDEGMAPDPAERDRRPPASTPKL